MFPKYQESTENFFIRLVFCMYQTPFIRGNTIAVSGLRYPTFKGMNWTEWIWITFGFNNAVTVHEFF